MYGDSEVRLRLSFFRFVGSGKTVVAELAMLRLFSTSPKQKTVYIAPLKALAAERMQDWCVRKTSVDR